jgi:hypothetical protein
MATIFCYLPTLAAAYLAPTLPDDPFSVEFAWLWLAGLPVAAVSAVFSGWITLVLIPPPVATSSVAPFGRVLVHGAPLLLAAIIVYAGTMIGMFLLLVPGILWSLATIVALPASVVERLGPKTAVLRSFDLTKGLWGLILGYTLVMYRPFGFMSLLIDPPLIDWPNAQVAEPSPLSRYGVRPILDAIWTAFSCAVGASIYRELAPNAQRVNG